MLMTDLWDLGEFDQKGTARTKWGTYDELKQLQKVAKENDILLYFDAVLNHKASADETEKCRAIEVEWEGRNPLSLFANNRSNQICRRGH
jgi:alpha-amylase